MKRIFQVFKTMVDREKILIRQEIVKRRFQFLRPR